MAVLYFICDNFGTMSYDIMHSCNPDKIMPPNANTILLQMVSLCLSAHQLCDICVCF